MSSGSVPSEHAQSPAPPLPQRDPHFGHGNRTGARIVRHREQQSFVCFGVTMPTERHLVFPAREWECEYEVGPFLSTIVISNSSLLLIRILSSLSLLFASTHYSQSTL